MAVEQPNRFSQTDFSDRSAGSGEQPGATSEPGGPEALHRAQRQLEELAELARFYAAARWDAARSSFRRALTLSLLGLAAALVLASVLVTCGVLVVLGIADLLAVAMGDRPWAGALVTAVGLLVILFGAGWLALGRLNRGFRERIMHVYARRREEQRARFGHDVGDVARNPKSQRS